MIVVGRARQDIDWLANNTDGWIWRLSDYKRLPDLIQEWRAARMDGTFHPYGYGTFLELAEDPDAPMRYMTSIHGMHIGRNRLIELWKMQEEQSVNHVALNLKPNRRPAQEILQELAEFVLPHFPAEQEVIMTITCQQLFGRLEAVRGPGGTALAAARVQIEDCGSCDRGRRRIASVRMQQGVPRQNRTTPLRMSSLS